MKLISSQPDQLYFLWQLQVQLYNFHQLGLEDDAVVLLGVTPGSQPSKLSQFIADNTTATVLWYPVQFDLTYSPAIQPYLFHRYYLTAGTGKNEAVFFHDSDVVFTQMPNFYRLLDDDVTYVSDTRSYLGLDYLLSKGEQQMIDMARIVGIDPEEIRSRDSGCGGAQLLIKSPNNPEMWLKMAHDGLELYKFLSGREHAWTGSGYPIQKWTAGMWSMLWNLWLHNKQTKIAPSLAFSWGSDNIDRVHGTSILHLAGVTSEMQSTHFHKSSFVHSHPFVHPVSMNPVHHPANGSHVYVAMMQKARDYWINKGWSHDLCISSN